MMFLLIYSMFGYIAGLYAMEKQKQIYPDSTEKQVILAFLMSLIAFPITLPLGWYRERTGYYKKKNNEQ